jgi:hypothetical protein
MKIRCSQLSKVMGKVDTDTFTNNLIDIYTQDKYNRREEIKTKYMSKGNAVEEDSITLVSRKLRKAFQKNESTLSNEWILGTPDFFEGESIQNAEIIHDVKSSWSLFTFTRNKFKRLNPAYYWQAQGYMDLTGAKTAYFHHCLVNTPYGMIQREILSESYKYEDMLIPAWVELMIIQNHTFDRKTFDEVINRRDVNVRFDDKSKAVYDGFIEISWQERIATFKIERNEKDILEAHSRVEYCRKKYAEMFEINQQ